MINQNFTENNVFAGNTVSQNSFQWNTPQIHSVKKSKAPFILATLTFCLFAVPAIFIFIYNCYIFIYQNFGGANIGFAREVAGYVLMIAIIFLFLYTNWANWVMLVSAILLMFSVLAAIKNSDKRASVWIMNIASTVMIITMLIFMKLPDPNISNMSTIVLNLIAVLGTESIVTILLLIILAMHKKKHHF